MTTTPPDQPATTGGMTVPVHLMSAILPVSWALLHDDRTPEEKAANEARWDAFRAQRKADRRALWLALESETDTTLAAVIAHHKPVAPGYHEDEPEADPADAVCDGCDISGYEAEPPEWPCSTTVLVAETRGIDVGTATDIYPRGR